MGEYSRHLMNYETFYQKFLSHYYRENDYMRIGQSYMNEFYRCNPELYKKVPADLDCYYNDKLFGACSDWVRGRWEDTSQTVTQDPTDAS